MYITKQLEALVPELVPTPDETGATRPNPITDLVLERAKNIICNFCNIESVPYELEYLQVDIAVKIYNRMGQEGSTSYSEGGKSQSFGDILSSDVKKELYRFRVLP